MLSSQQQLLYLITVVSVCQQLFHFSFCLGCSPQRKRYNTKCFDKCQQLFYFFVLINFTLSECELKQMDYIVSPLLLNGPSLHHIIVHHATARNIDTPRTVRMQPRNKGGAVLLTTHFVEQGLRFAFSDNKMTPSRS